MHHREPIGPLLEALEQQGTNLSLHKTQPLHRSTLDSLPHQIAVLDRNGQIIAVNKAWKRSAAQIVTTAAAIGLGSNYLEVLSQSRKVSNSIPRIIGGIGSVLEGSKQHFVLEWPHVSGGTARQFLLSVTPWGRPGEGAVVCYVDTSTSRRSKALEEGHGQVLERLAKGGSLGEVLAQLALTVESQLRPDARCSILLLDPRENVLRQGAAPNLPGEYNDAVDGIAIGPAAGSCGTAAYRKQRVVVTEIMTDPLWSDYRELARRFSLQSCWSHPIQSMSGEVLGTFAIYADQPHDPDDYEFHLIERAAYLAELAIERTRTREALQALAGRLFRSQEEERRRIARELHDDINQQIAALAIEIAHLKRRFPAAEASALNQISSLHSRTMGLANDVHRLSHELHPAALEHLGLVESLRSHCHEFSRHTAIRVKLTQRQVPKTIPPTVALCLYRIAQESLRNISRYSEAQEARVSIVGNRSGIRLCITDTGVGFDSRRVKEKGTLGLISMQERVLLLGGNFSLKSRPQRGTSIEIYVPL